MGGSGSRRFFSTSTLGGGSGSSFDAQAGGMTARSAVRSRLRQRVAPIVVGCYLALCILHALSAVADEPGSLRASVDIKLYLSADRSKPAPLPRFILDFGPDGVSLAEATARPGVLPHQLARWKGKLEALQGQPLVAPPLPDPGPGTSELRARGVLDLVRITAEQLGTAQELRESHNAAVLVAGVVVQQTLAPGVQPGEILVIWQAQGQTVEGSRDGRGGAYLESLSAEGTVTRTDPAEGLPSGTLQLRGGMMLSRDGSPRPYSFDVEVTLAAAKQ